MEKVTVRKLQTSNFKHQKIIMLTAYDYPFARILDEVGVDIILVGDSLGNVVLGLPNTRYVTMPDMLHHTKAVARGVKRALLVADMPFRALNLSNARRLIAAGAQAVKVEGTSGMETIRKIVSDGIPVMGHLGYLPQTDKKPEMKKSRRIIDQAKELERVGAFAVVLEMVAPALARKVTKAIKIPTIGIGSGNDCDGQVLVTHDLLGLGDWIPSFVRPKVNLNKITRQAIKSFISETRRCLPL